jgi:hypothetical protein
MALPRIMGWSCAHVFVGMHACIFPPIPAHLHVANRCFAYCAFMCVPGLQRMVLQHVKPDTILVGHALENDLNALKVSRAGLIKPKGLAVQPTWSYSTIGNCSCRGF